MEKFIKKNLLAIIGTIVGIIAGFLYYKFIGCSSGTCPITSSPILSMIWGAALGGLILSMFKKNKNE